MDKELYGSIISKNLDQYFGRVKTSMISEHIRLNSCNKSVAGESAGHPWDWFIVKIECTRIVYMAQLNSSFGEGLNFLF